MSIYGTFAKKIIAPLWAIKENTPYLKYLKYLDGAKNRPVEDFRNEQLQRLRKLLLHAASNTHFYKERLDLVSKDPANITWNQFSQVSLLTKDDIRSSKSEMFARNMSPACLIPVKTSGSTGVSIDLFIDEDSSQWKRAVTITYDRWAGWDIGERVGAIWGNPQHNINWRSRLRNFLLERFTYLDTLKMDENEMFRFHKALCKKPPSILFGHAHSLFLFARFMQQKGLSGIRPRGVISTCMVLHEFERKSIEEVFGCRVTNRYGCEEVSLIACECSEGNMHLNCDTLIVEFIRDGKLVPPGEPGAIVVTDLSNYGMPFIRYKVGDVGIPSTKTSCPCGCTYPMMDSLEGRVADYVVTPDGNYISGISLTENFAMHLPGVKQMQIVQEEIDFLLFRIVKGETFSEQTVVDINKLAFERFGNRMRFAIEHVDSIQSEQSGKYRFCISKISNPFT